MYRVDTTHARRVSVNKNEVLEDLKNRILSGDIPAGTWLTERELCEEYGISRTPVREVIWNLIQMNIVEGVSERGNRVRTFSINDIIEVFNAREAIEGECARLACLSVDADYLGRIEELEAELRALSPEKDARKCVEVGIKVHAFIQEKANNRYLCEYSDRIRTVTSIIRNITAEYGNIEEESLKDHLQILGTLKNRDGNASAQAMRSHLHRTCRDIVTRCCNNLLGTDMSFV